MNTEQARWTPLVIVAMAQLLLAFNITALKISIDAIVTSYAAPASAVKRAIIAYSLVVAGCIMLGAKLGPVFGARRVFRVTVALFGFTMLVMALSADVRTMIMAQVAAGAASAALVPTSISLITESYTAQQQIKAVQWLAAARSLSLVPAFIIAGAVTTWLDWRLTFLSLSLLAAGIHLFSDKLGEDPTPAQNEARLSTDNVGFALLTLAVLSIGVGAENLLDWGVVRAAPGAPFSVLRVSPAPLAIVCGLLFIKAFVVWSRRRRALGDRPLCSPELIAAPRERSVLFSIFMLGAVSAAITFLIPLYIEIVQGRNSLHTALALSPFILSSVAAAMLIGRIRRRFGARYVTRYSFLAVAAGLALLGVTIKNDWSDPMVILSMIVVGLGEGTLATLLFNALIDWTPSEAASDVEPLCDATSHLAAAVGTALAGTLVIGLLSMNVDRALISNPYVASELQAHLNLDRVAFVSNDHLREIMEGSRATPANVEEAVRINTQVRLRALKISFFVLASLALLAFIPAAGVQGDDAKPHEDTLHSSAPTNST